MINRDREDWGTSLVPINGLSPKAVICALGNGRKSSPAQDGRGTGGEEFDESYLDGRMDYARRVLRDHYQTDKRDLLTNPRFLGDLHIPVSFVSDPVLGHCLETRDYDTSNGQGSARETIDDLRLRHFANRKKTRMQEQSQEEEPAPATVLSISCAEAVSFCESSPGDFDIYCNQISDIEVLSLLYAILKARTRAHPVDEGALMPRSVPEKYLGSGFTVPLFAASADAYAQAMLEEFGIEVLVYPRGNVFRICGNQHEALVRKLISLVCAFNKRKQQNVALGLLGLIAMLTTLFAYFVLVR